MVSRLARVKTARDILEAIADGQRDPGALAALAASRVKGGREGVEHALEGMLPGEHHLMLIRIHLDHVTFLDRSIAAVEDEIDAALGAIPAAWGISAGGVPSPGPGPGAAALTAVERLAEIPGVSPKLAMAIIAETGLDMTRFPTAGHLVSRGWARTRRPPVRPAQPQTEKRGTATPTSRATAPRPPTAPPAPGPSSANGSPPQQAPGREQGQMCRGPLHPDHHLAPARQPRSPVHRPRGRLARTQNRPRPQDPRSPPPAPGPGLDVTITPAA